MENKKMNVVVLSDLGENMSKKISFRLLSLMFITVLLFIVRENFKINISLPFFIVYYCVCFLLLKEYELLSFFLFLIPLSIGPLLYSLNVIFGCLFLLKNFNKITINNSMIIGLLLILYEGLHVFINVFLGYNESIIKYFGFCLCLVVTIICISDKKIKYDYVNLVLSWSYGLFAFLTILFFKYVSYYGFIDVFQGLRRFGIVHGETTDSISLMINPNGLGRLVILTVFCLITIFKFEGKYMLRIFMLIIYFTVFGFLSGSRSFILIFTLLWIMYIGELVFNIRDNKKNMLWIIFIIIILVFLIYNYMEPVLNMLISRFKSENITGSRILIYKKYLEVLMNSPLYLILGSGMQDYSNKYGVRLSYYSENVSSHNVILEVISMWGLIGLFIVLLLILTLYKSICIKKNLVKRTLLPFLPALGLFLSAQFGQFFNGFYYSFPTLVLVFLNIKYVYLKMYTRTFKS